jgi:hypothetical protein
MPILGSFVGSLVTGVGRRTRRRWPGAWVCFSSLARIALRRQRRGNLGFGRDAPISNRGTAATEGRTALEPESPPLQPRRQPILRRRQRADQPCCALPFERRGRKAEFRYFLVVDLRLCGGADGNRTHDPLLAKQQVTCSMRRSASQSVRIRISPSRRHSAVCRTSTVRCVSARASQYQRVSPRRPIPG